MGKKYNNLITTTAGFNYPANQPLDDRAVVESYSDLAELKSYEGIEVYVIADQKSYKLVGTEWKPVATEAYVDGKVANKVDRVNGKGLSTNDFTDAYKQKVDAALQSYTETDPTVPAWAKASTKPTYKYSEITEKPTLAIVATSGSYNDLKDKPFTPTADSLGVISYSIAQNLTSEQKAQARANIGAGEGGSSGSTEGFATEEYVNSQIANLINEIENGLDEIIEAQNNLLGVSE